MYNFYPWAHWTTQGKFFSKLLSGRTQGQLPWPMLRCFRSHYSGRLWVGEAPFPRMPTFSLIHMSIHTQSHFYLHAHTCSHVLALIHEWANSSHTPMWYSHRLPHMHTCAHTLWHAHTHRHTLPLMPEHTAQPWEFAPVDFKLPVRFQNPWNLPVFRT